MRRFYVIGLKNHVELRSARKPPVASRTKAMVKSNLGAGKFAIHVVHYRGGKVVRCLRSNLFTVVTGIYVAEGQCIEVSKEIVEKLPGEGAEISLIGVRDG